MKRHNKNSRQHNVSAALAFFGAMMTFLPQVQEFIPVEWYGPLLVVIGVGYHYLRSITTKPIEER